MAKETSTENYRAVVQKVFEKGEHGPYAKARAKGLGTITFSLDRKVWKESREPEEGDIVILSEVRQKRAGWRAESGRFVRPSDEIQETGEAR